MVDMQRVANELKPLIKLAKEQNWTIESGKNDTRLVWKGPNGEGPVYTGYRCNGRDLHNFRAELVRAGLNLEGDQKVKEEHDTFEEMEGMLETAKTVTGEDIKNAMNLLLASFSTLQVKGEMFDQAKQDADEWKQLAEEATAETERWKTRARQAETLLDGVRTCFGLAGWAILPEIAKILGIDAQNGTPALATQATTSRTEIKQ
jgi:hypothetical protein